MSTRKITDFSGFEIPGAAGYVDVIVDSTQYMAVGQFHDLSDGVLLMHGVIRGINGNIVTFENVPMSDGNIAGTMGDGEIDHSHASPIVTPVVAGLVPPPTNDPRDVLLGTAVFGRLRETPLVIDLHEVAMSATLDAWVYVLPPVTLNLPRTTPSLIEVALSLHFSWTANNGSEAYCDWSIDGSNHFRRTYHVILDKKLNTDVNGVDLTFWIQVSGDTPAIAVQGRQHAGPTGMTIVGLETTAYPELQSRAIIFDGGPM